VSLMNMKIARHFQENQAVLKACDDGILIKLSWFWILSIVLFVIENMQRFGDWNLFPSSGYSRFCSCLAQRGRPDSCRVVLTGRDLRDQESLRCRTILTVPWDFISNHVNSDTDSPS
jgi:hypothetical protein